MSSIRRVLARTVVFLAITAFFTPPLAANALTATITGEVTAFTSTSGSSWYMNVKDLGANNDVYSEYYRSANPDHQIRLTNSSGKGTTVKSGPGSKIFKMDACVLRTLQPDPCTGWVT